ncbi:MAG TPA: hypothetical protein VHE57_06010, partial [Mycobacteriales bacterium]|nr:hypothetical protein [Mycobacteriales bacterium]
MLVVGSGNTGAEIALDLVETGAGRVRLAVRTSPHVALRMRRMVIGDLSRYGLPEPADGLLERVVRDDQIPLVDMGFLDAVKAGKITRSAACFARWE